jgi:PAS domain S-box-containing protein/putative nucleotidyltransferase with HDIG domain
MSEMEEKLRKTGIEIIDDVPWGTHFCQFYKTKKDLIDILVPYFKTGLENNEFCLCVTSDPLNEKEAKDAMRKAMPNFDQYQKKGQIEIYPYTEWYFKEGGLNLQRVLNDWVGKLNRALEKGYDGIRVSGNMAWLENKDWKSFADYEKEVNSVISKYKIIAICTYPLEKCGAYEIIDVVSNHQFALIRREDKWEIIESSERKKAEEILRESEEKYRDLYENAPDGYHSIGPDGTILEVNTTWLKMLGYERDEVIGKMKLTDLLTDDGLRTFQDTFSDFKKKGFIENVEYYLKRKDGILLPVLINATAIYDEKGNFLKSRSIVRDISARVSYRKKLEHSLKEWRATFDSMPYGVMLLNSDFNIIRTNSYISRLLGIPFRDIIGRKCYELIHGSDKPIECCPLLKSSKVNGTETYEFYDARFNKYFMGHVKSVSDKEGPTKNYVLSLVDITEIKDKEERLIESHNAFLNMLKDLDFSYRELKKLYEGLIYSFVNAIDAKSPWTKGHSVRVTNYAIAIAKEMGLKDKDIETLRTSALLHDIGKIGIYGVILDKPEKLTKEEFDLLKMHPVKGEEILMPIGQLQLSKLQNLLAIIRSHHERTDGKGYPDGLKGDEIPLLARIICIADSFDSMTSERPYRPTPGKEYAISELKRYSGTQFDPEAVETFLRVLEKSQV